MAELSAAILEAVSDQIGSAIGGRVTVKPNYVKDLDKMRMALYSVEARLEDAERRSITDARIRLWLKRLNETMYAISDTICEFEAEMDQLPVRKSSFERHVPKRRLDTKMNLLRKELETIIIEHRTFNLLADKKLNVNDTRKTSAYMGVEQIVGRTKEMDTILNLISESKTLTILPIYGIGGLGKTTLANLIYNSTQVKGYYRVWVYVSQTFDLRKIGNSIIAQLSEKNNQSEYTGLQMIHNSLSKLLSHKKIIIVLDDLWEHNYSALNKLKAMLQVGKDNKVVVIVTTRDEDIAKGISTIQPHKLALLTNDMCWSIIKDISQFRYRDDKKELKQIGKDIASKCGGVGLSAQILGHALHSMMPSEWKLVRDSGIYFVSTSVIASLRLSYSAMPSYLKLCFAYCAIFPKGHKIVKVDLIYQWASLGLIEPTNESFWKLGERYITQLLGLSFLQDSTSPSIVEDSGITLLTMHDLAHDLARFVLDDEILVRSEHGNEGDASATHCSKIVASHWSHTI